jgi:hypothetical protein
MKLLQITLLFLNILLVSESYSQINSDIALLEQTIEANHISPFDKLDKALWEEEFNIFKTLDSISSEETNVNLIRIVSLLQDEHTMLFPNEKFIFPLRLKWVNEGAVIAITDSLNGDLLGATLVSINGVLTDSIFRQISSLFKQDNPWYVIEMTEYFFCNTTILKGLHFINNLSECNVVVKNRAGEFIERQIRFYALEPNMKINWVYGSFLKKMIPYHKNSNYWFEYLEDKNTLYMNFQKCTEDKDQPFKKFNKELFDCIAKNSPQKLILDLRFNPGGNSRVLYPFIKKIQTSYLNKRGNFFVLIGKKVISSSLMNAIELHTNTEAIFVGQPTSGNLIHYGEIQSVQLEHLNARLIYSTKKFDLMNGTSSYFKPDVDVSYSLDDLLNGIDPALETVFSYP